MTATATSLDAIPAPAEITAAQVAIARDVLRNGPATSAFIAARLRASPYSVSKRTSELVIGGILARIDRARNPTTGRWASVLGRTDKTQDFVDGYAELAPPPHKTRRDALGRVLKAARNVYGKSRAIGDGQVGVPMDPMVELGVALTQLDDVRLVPR